VPAFIVVVVSSSNAKEFNPFIVPVVSVLIPDDDIFYYIII
jgi:hypothetical protein